MSIKGILGAPLTNFWESMHWHPSSTQIEQFISLQKVLTHWNRQVNLTRLVKDEDYWIAHVFDSLWPLKNELESPEQKISLIDIGSGCGFPGLAVAIAMPQCKVTLVEANSRKALILKKISSHLGLSKRIKVLTERAEVTGRNPRYRGMFDLAMARAVGAPPVVAEYLIPLIKPTGEALLFVGKWYASDERLLKKALIQLEAKIKLIERCELPNDKGTRHSVRLISKTTCPGKFPRSAGVPRKKPLGTMH